jgi:glucosamine--fructose-6-phosphate aminotransferase (isomerizing)
MCGIFGYISNNTSCEKVLAKKILENLYKLSETRGKEASGLMISNKKEIHVIKDSIPASELIKKKIYKQTLHNFLKSNDEICAIGHSRLVTNGVAEDNNNNQPFFFSGISVVHNGIITNEDSLWKKNLDLGQKFTNLDTEIFVKLFKKNLDTFSITKALKKTYESIEGVANVSILFEKIHALILTTNNGSLYYAESKKKESLIFASEKYILKKCIDLIDSKNKFFSVHEITHIKPNTGIIVNLLSMKRHFFNFEKENLIKFEEANKKIIDISENKESLIGLNNFQQKKNDYSVNFDEYNKNREKISSLKRCTKCILPITMPFISFDDKGVCNYCKEYKFHKPKGLNEFKKLFEKKNENFDFIATFSGGRDSSYGVHVLKKKLNLDFLTFTYDWGMVTDLARRNQMRMCGSLGIEHILVSADINKKRKNIKKNVLAWLKKPELGMIPLFMAGDKQYFYWGNKIAKQNNLKKILLFENLLETTKFKSGFCGIKPIQGTKNTYTLSFKNKISLIFYYLKNFIKNPSYINTSILDTFSAFFSYYILDHEWINLFDYIDWDEEEINKVLKQNYNWEISNDTISTWRIGDGTAPFYNYIYYTIAGFTENDTFRSNQIRQGKISRKHAMNLSIDENKPRFESINEYLCIIGLDFFETLKKIDNAQKKY